MVQKYIRHKTKGFMLWATVGGGEPCHSDVADLMLTPGGDPADIVSAGFVIFHGGKPVCYGESTTLDLSHHPDDTMLLAEQLRIKL